MNISDIDAALTRLLFTTKLRIAIYEKLCRYIDNGVPLVVSLEEMHRFISDDGKKLKDFCGGRYAMVKSITQW